jgi:hypothetical protein
MLREAWRRGGVEAWRRNWGAASDPQLTLRRLHAPATEPVVLPRQLRPPS